MIKIKKYCMAAFKYMVNADYRFKIDSGRGKYNDMPDREYLQRRFRAELGKSLDLDNPQTFNEKLQWLKLYNRKPEYTMMVDKYKVREYIAQELGEEYLIPLLGVWNDPDEIDFDALPDQFVLKCNHNSGLGMCICKDKSKLDIPKVKAELRKGLKQDYYLTGREWPYKDVPRKIICEKYMTNGTGEELNDYKLMCFNGKVKTTFVCSNRFSKNGLNITFYDTNWTRMPFERVTHLPSSEEIEKPKTYEQMVSIAEKLAQEIPFLRVDFYENQGKLYFGEMTFFPASGFEEFSPSEWDKTLGEWIKLPQNGGGYLVIGEGFVLWLHAQKQEDVRDVDAELSDYKFYCFDGIVRLVMINSDRNSNKPTKADYFDRNFNWLDFTWGYQHAEVRPQKPEKFEEMIEIAEKLAKGLPHIRVDLYECNGQIYFGELTFFDGSGFDKIEPLEWDYKIGKMLKLPASLKQ